MTTRDLRRWLEIKPDAVSDEMAFALLGERGVEPDGNARDRIWQALELELALPPTAADDSNDADGGEPTRGALHASSHGAGQFARLLGLSLLLLAAAGTLLWRSESRSRIHHVATPVHAPLTARTPSPSEPSAPVRAVSADPPASSSAPIEPAVKATHTRARRPVAAPLLLNTAGPVAIAVDDPNAELDLLARARRVIASAPARTLALTDEHLAHFPAGTFALEREVLAIDALRRLGRRSEAQARVARFMREHPDSIHAARVEGMLQTP